MSQGPRPRSGGRSNARGHRRTNFTTYHGEHAIRPPGHAHSQGIAKSTAHGKSRSKQYHEHGKSCSKQYHEQTNTPSHILLDTGFPDPGQTWSGAHPGDQSDYANLTSGSGARWVQVPPGGGWRQPAASPQPTWHDTGALGTHGMDWSGAQLPLDAGCGWAQGWPPQAGPGQQYVWLTPGAAASSSWDWAGFQLAPGDGGWEQASVQQGSGYLNWNGMQPPPDVCGAWAWEQASAQQGGGYFIWNGMQPPPGVCEAWTRAQAWAQQGGNGLDWHGVQPPPGVHGFWEQGRAQQGGRSRRRRPARRQLGTGTAPQAGVAPHSVDTPAPDPLTHEKQHVTDGADAPTLEKQHVTDGTTPPQALQPSGALICTSPAARQTAAQAPHGCLPRAAGKCSDGGAVERWCDLEADEEESAAADAPAPSFFAGSKGPMLASCTSTKPPRIPAWRPAYRKADTADNDMNADKLAPALKTGVRTTSTNDQLDIHGTMPETGARDAVPRPIIVSWQRVTTALEECVAARQPASDAVAHSTTNATEVTTVEAKVNALKREATLQDGVSDGDAVLPLVDALLGLTVCRGLSLADEAVPGIDVPGADAMASKAKAPGADASGATACPFAQAVLLSAGSSELLVRKEAALDAVASVATPPAHAQESPSVDLGSTEHPLCSDLAADIAAGTAGLADGAASPGEPFFGTGPVFGVALLCLGMVVKATPPGQMKEALRTMGFVGTAGALGVNAVWGAACRSVFRVTAWGCKH